MSGIFFRFSINFHIKLWMTVWAILKCYLGWWVEAIISFSPISFFNVWETLFPASHTKRHTPIQVLPLKTSFVLAHATQCILLVAPHISVTLRSLVAHAVRQGVAEVMRNTYTNFQHDWSSHPNWSGGKILACHTGDPSSIPHWRMWDKIIAKLSQVTINLMHDEGSIILHGPEAWCMVSFTTPVSQSDCRKLGSTSTKGNKPWCTLSGL